MPRPVKQNADYFRHENNMRNDIKIKALRNKFGMEGYGAYCMLLEVLTEQDKIQTLYNPLQIELLAADFGIDLNLLKQILEYMKHVDLIQIDKYIRCRQLDNRLKIVFDTRENSLDDLREDKKEVKKEDKYNKEITDVINYLNEVTGKRYNTNTESTRESIRARLREGHSVEDCEKVIDVKTAEWKDTDMDKYLRPKTLFAPSKFEGYLNEYKPIPKAIVKRIRGECKTCPECSGKLWELRDKAGREKSIWECEDCGYAI